MLILVADELQRTGRVHVRPFVLLKQEASDVVLAAVAQLATSVQDWVKR